MAENPNYQGFKWDEVNSRLNVLIAGNVIGYFDSTGFVLASGKGLVVPGSTTLNTIAYTWPADNGEANEDLNTSGAGVLTWAA